MENHRTPCCTPSGARLRYFQLRNRVLNIDIPPKSPFGKGGLRQGSRIWGSNGEAEARIHIKRRR